MVTYWLTLLFVKRVPFAADVTDTGSNGSDITMWFTERYYEKYDTMQIVGSKQQVIVLQTPIRKADNFWEYTCQLLDSTLEEELDVNFCKTGMETRFLTNYQPEFSEEGLKIALILLYSSLVA